MCSDEGIVAQHVAIARRGRAHAEVVLLAVAQPEHRIEVADRVEQRAPDVHAESDAGRQVGIGRHRGLRAAPAPCGSGSRAGGHALFSQKRGSEQISALFENGVIVPMVASDCAQRASASSQPARHDRVGIEQHDVGAGARLAHAAIGGQREAEIALVREQHELRQARARELARNMPPTRGIGATRRRSAAVGSRPRYARSTLSTQRRRSSCGVVHRHDDVDRALRRFHIGAPRTTAADASMAARATSAGSADRLTLRSRSLIDCIAAARSRPSSARDLAHALGDWRLRASASAVPRRARDFGQVRSPRRVRRPAFRDEGYAPPGDPARRWPP